MGSEVHRSDARLDEAARVERSDARRALALSDVVIAESRLGGDERAISLQARALLQRGRALFFLGELEDSLDAAAASSAAAREANDPDTLVRARTLLGHLFSALGHDEAAVAELEETTALARELGTRRDVRAASMMALGSTLRRMERFEDAFTWYRQAEDDARAAGPSTLANLLVNLASAAWQGGKIAEARASLLESRAIYEKLGRTDLLAWQDAIEAWVDGASGNTAQAIAHARAAIDNEASVELEAKMSATRALAHALSRAPSPELADLPRARQLLETLVEESRARQRTGDIPMILRELSAVCAKAGDLQAALRHSDEAYELLRAQQAEGRRRRHTAEAFRLRVVRAEIEAEQLRLRAAALEAANRELETLSRERALLLSTVSHDLRSPLTAILLSLQYLRQTNGSTDDILALVADSVNRMMGVLDRTLSTDAIRAGRAPIRRATVDVADVVRRCVAGLQPLADRKRIVLTVSGPDEVPAETDEPALARIVENLVSNALKFSTVERAVDVSVSSEGGAIRIVVRDEGPGFAAGEIEMLFELGARGSAAPTAGEDSTGVGLHVVQDLVRALGGSIRLGNRADRPGAVAEVSLPSGAVALS